MLKIFAQSPNALGPETHVFTFTSSTSARVEADSIKDALSTAIQKARNAPNPATTATISDGADGGGQSAAMAIASAISSGMGSSKEPGWLDDDVLKGNIKLQQSLLKSDSTLQKIFAESVRAKPESISISQFTSQFWSARVHLLRAHAIQNSQKRGAYNILSTIKPKMVGEQPKLSISPEQIQLIFNQHPLIKRVYDENVPKLDEKTFWSSFFSSRLFKKLKGEMIGDSDPPDPIMDKYLQQDDDPDLEKRMFASHIPQVINIEGNEENHSQRKGNQPDLTMRPQRVEEVPIIRTLNSLSEKIMSQVTPVDSDPSKPIGMDEETFNELVLQDLRAESSENRILLNIRDQKRFFANTKQGKDDGDDAIYRSQNPLQVISNLQKNVDPAATYSDALRGLDLQSAIGFDDESDSDEDEAGRALHKPNGKAEGRRASAQILGAIARRRSQMTESGSTGFGETLSAEMYGLPSTVFERLQLTHATTTEFLHHFWVVFLSGDGSRAEELASMVESLSRAMDRIQAVAAAAEEERDKIIRANNEELARVAEQSGRRRRQFDASGIGGANVVNEFLQPTVNAVAAAVAQYRRALAAESTAITV